MDKHYVVYSDDAGFAIAVFSNYDRAVKYGQSFLYPRVEYGGYKINYEGDANYNRSTGRYLFRYQNDVETRFYIAIEPVVIDDEPQYYNMFI